jgi:NADH dehydrogenase
VLEEAADRLLGEFPERLSARAGRALERLGVTPMTDRAVVDVGPRAVTLQPADPGARPEQIATRTVVWAAGVRASGLAQALGRSAGAPLDRAGRLAVSSELTLPGHPEVFALGDMVAVHDGEGRTLALPGVAPVAMQQGRYAGKAIRGRLRGRTPRPFRYVDKGNVATIGRLKAVADVRGVPWPARSPG